MTPAEQIAWHRSEADRIEAEERARRPALAAGQVWEHRESGRRYLSTANGGADPSVASITDGTWWCKSWGALEYVGLARDVLRVVPPGSEEIRHSGPDTPITVQIAPQVAPEPTITITTGRGPTGAELVGVKCWLKESEDDPWVGPAVVDEYDHKGVDGFWFKSLDPAVTGAWFVKAKPYVEGVAP